MEKQPEEQLGSQGDGGIADEVETEAKEEPDGKKGPNKTRIAALLVIALLALTFTIVRMVQNQEAAKAGDYHSGDVLHFVENDAPFGTVIEVDEAHKFEAGPPTSAFLVRLAASDQEAWIGRGFAAKALYKASSVPVDQLSKTDAAAGEAAPETE